MSRKSNKIKVFISSKIGDTLDDQKYMLVRTALTELLEDTNLFDVYTFEGSGASSITAEQHYTESLKQCDVCVFLIDNLDGVPDGVVKEIETVKKYSIPSLYYFCNSSNTEKTPLQQELLRADAPKHTTIASFHDFIRTCKNDLIDDVLLSYKHKRFSVIKSNNEHTQNGVYYNQENNNQLLSDITLTNYKYNENDLTTKYLSFLNFNINFEKDDYKNKFDYYCYKFLTIMFEENSITDFNLNIFLEEISKILPQPYYQVVEKRWYANQKYLLGEFNESLKLLREAYDMANEKSADIEQWLLQDILIDLRNREQKINRFENKYTFDTAAQNLLDRHAQKLIYPLVDRNNAEFYNWLEKDRTDKELQSYMTWSSYGDVSFLINYLSENFCISMLMGSYTHINALYGKMKSLAYHFSKTTGEWFFIQKLVSTNILALDSKGLRKTLEKFSVILEKMDYMEARNLYNYSKKLNLDEDKFYAKLLAIEIVGYYLEEHDFNIAWNDIKTQINQWIKGKQSPIYFEEQIFKTIKALSERIDHNDILSFCIEIFNQGSRRYYSKVLEILYLDIDYNKVTQANINKLINLLLEQAIDLKQNEERNFYNLLMHLHKLNYEKIIELEKISEFNYQEEKIHTFIFGEDYSSKELQDILFKNCELIQRIYEEGNRGVFTSYGRNPYLEIEYVLRNKQINLKRNKLMTALLKNLSDTLLDPKQYIENKVDAIRLYIFLLRYDTKLLETYKDHFIPLINNSNVNQANSSLLSIQDSNILHLGYLFLSTLFGENKELEIIEALSKIKTERQCIEASKLIKIFLSYKENIKVKYTILYAFLQFSLNCCNSDSITLRYMNIDILILLSSYKKYRDIISKRLLNIMNSDVSIVKSRILNEYKNLVLNRSYKLIIIKNARQDNNYVIRKIANTLSD